MMENIVYYLNNISPMTYLVVFFGGVAMSLTPCIFPLIPVVVGVIGASKGGASRSRGFVLSSIYVFGMAFTFSVLGLVAAMTGKLFGQVQTSPYAHLIVGNVIIIFALVMLDVIHLPVFLLQKAGAGKIFKGKGILPVFLMGMVSGLIASPCAAAVLGVLLTYVASTQNVVLGFSFLFVFALGFGTILIAIGTFAGILPLVSKSEKVMLVIQKIFAFGMILLGEYFIFRAGILT